jgi:endonuclease YncB( thermonuclease family)
VGGLDVNTAQVRQGMAWVYRQYNRDNSLLALEQEAKKAKRGLWSEPNAIPLCESGMAAEQVPQQEANQHKP